MKDRILMQEARLGGLAGWWRADAEAPTNPSTERSRRVGRAWARSLGGPRWKTWVLGRRFLFLIGRRPGAPEICSQWGYESLGLSGR